MLILAGASISILRLNTKIAPFLMLEHCVSRKVTLLDQLNIFYEYYMIMKPHTMYFTMQANDTGVFEYLNVKTQFYSLSNVIKI